MKKNTIWVIAACMVAYLALLLMQDFNEVTIGHRNNAMASAIQIGFAGVENFQKLYAVSDDYTSSLSKSCSSIDRVLNLQCLVVMPLAAKFYDLCRWWVFEKCIVLQVDKIALSEASIAKRIGYIVREPCLNFPTKQDISNQQKESHAPIPGIMSGELLLARKILGCDNDKPIAVKVFLIISPSSKTDEKISIFTTKIGE
jgi:hypothetical protein